MNVNLATSRLMTPPRDVSGPSTDASSGALPMSSSPDRTSSAEEPVTSKTGLAAQLGVAATSSDRIGALSFPAIAVSPLRP